MLNSKVVSSLLVSFCLTVPFSLSVSAKPFWKPQDIQFDINLGIFRNLDIHNRPIVEYYHRLVGSCNSAYKSGVQRGVFTALTEEQIKNILGVDLPEVTYEQKLGIVNKVKSYCQTEGYQKGKVLGTFLLNRYR